MSRTFCPSSILAAFIAGESFTGSNTVWYAVNNEQEWLLETVFSRRDVLELFKPEELRSWADTDAKRLNAILKQEGMDIQLEEFGDGGFGIVGVTHVGVQWLIAGEPAWLKDPYGRMFPSVHMAPSAYDRNTRTSTVRFEVYRAERHPHPVVRLATKSGDSYYLTIAQGCPTHDVELCRTIETIRTSLTPDRTSYEFLMFPMVDLKTREDIEWLKGICSDTYILDQAKKQTKLKVNHEGAEFKDVFAGVVKALGVRELKVVIINQPFLLWTERAGVPYPLLSAYIDQEHWRDPGNLSF